jgi:hypothetical protein
MSRRNPAAAIALAVLCTTSVACAFQQHTLEPYASDPAAGERLAAEADARCAAIRGDGKLPPRVFTSDGCSAWPDGRCADCCLAHDILYWCGGDGAARHDADREFRSCVEAVEGTATARAMYTGVRIGGWRGWPAPWRWGYGWTWPENGTSD